ncbi:MAG: carboxypeptidase-like regulatory domain-containing protein [Proteobacteria bacterium]|nr:carboxypeptidase-like regulatory domain-containing protein [Pseudomonadota bacterium]
MGKNMNTILCFSFIIFITMGLAGCKLSGCITTADGVPLEGVTLVLSGNTNGTTTTDSNGNYEFEVPNNDADYTITPSLNRYAFTPERYDVQSNKSTVDGLDFTGERVAYTLSGTLKTRYFDDPIINATLRVSGDASATSSTDINGNFELDIPTDFGTYTITPTLTRYVFNPAHIDITVDETTQAEDYRIQGINFTGEYMVSSEFNDITYYHACDNTGPPSIHRGDSAYDITFEVRDSDPVNQTPYWYKNGKYVNGTTYHARDIYRDNFSFETGRIGFYIQLDITSTPPQFVFRDSAFASDSSRFVISIEGTQLGIVYRGETEIFDDVIPHMTWFFLEMKFSDHVLTLFIDDEVIGSVAGSSLFTQPDTVSFGLGEAGLVSFDQILSANDPDRNLYELRSRTEF